MKDIEITAIFVDQIIRVEVIDALNATITVRDVITGNKGCANVTTAQAGAIMNLMIVGDAGLEELYAKHNLETVMSDLATQIDGGNDRNCLRCIP